MVMMVLALVVRRRVAVGQQDRPDNVQRRRRPTPLLNREGERRRIAPLWVQLLRVCVVRARLCQLVLKVVLPHPPFSVHKAIDSRVRRCVVCRCLEDEHDKQGKPIPENRRWESGIHLEHVCDDRRLDGGGTCMLDTLA